MAYKTILTHVDSFQTSKAHIAFAAMVAIEHEAHLIGLAPSGFATLPAGDYFGASARFVNEMQQELDESARVAAQVFEQECQRLTVDSYEPRVTTDSVISATLLQAGFVDLIIASQPAADAAKTVAGPGFVGDLLMDGCRPVLVVPNEGQMTPLAKRVVVAWNGSREGARAVTDAMPLLTRAEQVFVVVVNSTAQPVPIRSSTASELALFLARHGVTAEVKEVPLDTRVSTTLLKQVDELGAGLLVMGGYGHSRIREWVLGGTTREILANMHVPVLISH